ncbi:MAG: DMT family transporter [Candidatus Desulfofervidaceae bacterium]|nr:DMT family transporter [Candidatus Desulfofervidaceae bacterium]MDL1969951.1 DMT family transporter [Candidatus Desulfofervidaceae bacterium]
MGWFFWALLSAFSLATADVFTKKYLKAFSPWQMGAIRTFYAIPFLLPILFLPWPSLDKDFWFTLFLLYPLEILALILYMAALKLSPLSLTLPFLSFTPVFLILTGWLILKELPNLWGGVGICLVVGGSYLLYLPRGFLNLKSVFTAFWREKGSLLMLFVALIYAITSALGKKAIIHSNPLFFGAFYYVGLGMFFLPSISKHPELRQKNVIPLGLILGFFIALMIISHVIAISQTKAVYMISVKRLSPVFGVIYGGIILKEKHIPLRLFATGCMCLGAIIIYIWGLG